MRELSKKEENKNKRRIKDDIITRKVEKLN